MIISALDEEVTVGWYEFHFLVDICRNADV